MLSAAARDDRSVEKGWRPPLLWGGFYHAGRKRCPDLVIRMKPQLRAAVCDVSFKGRNARVTGLFFAKTKRFVVLLNNVRQKAQLGRLQRTRYEHIEPEADIHIFPRTAVTRLQILDSHDK